MIKLILAATIALLQLGACASSREIPEFPKNRFTPWNQLKWIVRNDARYLLFVPETWNRFLSGPLERMSYEQVAEFLGLNDAKHMAEWQTATAALQNVAVDSKTWDCWINHYIGNDWDELENKHNVSWAFEELGWNSSTWKSSNPEDWPDTEEMSFDQLTPAQTFAAESICCPAEIWDGVPLNTWEFNAEGISTVQLEFEKKFTSSPTATPTATPSEAPSRSPVASPSMSPSSSPSLEPTTGPTIPHTSSPTKSFSESPTLGPTVSPTPSPSMIPTPNPSMAPTDQPSKEPSSSPSLTHSSSPSKEPTFSPTQELPECMANFTLVLLTDKYPRETTWTLTETVSGTVVAESLGYFNDFETHLDTVCIEYDTCYMFTINDKWDDGICCENGPGSYAGYIELANSPGGLIEIPGLNGGAFFGAVQHKFCLDQNGQLMEGEGLNSAIGVRFNGRNGERRN